MKAHHILSLLIVISSRVGYSADRCYQVTSPLTPIIDVETGSKDLLIKVLLTDPEAPQFYAEGRVRRDHGRNILTLAFLTKDKEGERSKILRGKESLHKIIEIIKRKNIEIDAFSSMWNDHFRDYDAPSDNLIAFMKAYRDSYVRSNGSMSLPNHIDHYMETELKENLIKAAESGAWATWSGQQMRELGFHHIEEVQIIENPRYRGADGSMGTIDIRVLWTKKKSKDEMLLHVKDSQRSKSNLPRFHMMIQNMSKYFNN